MNAYFVQGKVLCPSPHPHPIHHFLSSFVSDIWQFRHLRNVFDDAFAFALKVNHDYSEPKIWGCNCTINRFIKTLVF